MDTEPTINFYDKMPREEVKIQCIATGGHIPDDFEGVFLGSVLMGPFVWHFYKVWRV